MLKGIVYPKSTNLSVITYSHFIPNPYILHKEKKTTLSNNFLFHVSFHVRLREYHDGHGKEEIVEKVIFSLRTQIILVAS